MRSEADIQRVCLEGRYELLEATRARYAELTLLLRKGTAEEIDGALRTLLADERAVSEAIAVVERRAEADRWTKRSAVMRCLEELQQDRRRLFRALDAPWNPATGDPFVSAMERALELREERRRFRPEVRLAQILAHHRGEAAQAERLGQVIQATQRFQAFDSAGGLAALEPEWIAGVTALQRLRDAVRAEPNGASLLAAFQQRVRAVSREENPHRELSGWLRAESWGAEATQSLRMRVSASFRPVELHDEELVHAARTLRAGPEAAPGAGLPRAALLRLAAAIGVVRSKPLSPIDVPALLPDARRADEDRTDPDFNPMLDLIRGLGDARARAREPFVPALFRRPTERREAGFASTLAEAVALLA